MENRKLSAAEKRRDDTSRVMPLLVAGLFCFFVAVLLGYGSWRLFGSPSHKSELATGGPDSSGPPVNSKEGSSEKQETQNAQSKVDPSIAAKTDSSPKIEGAVTVSGGETAVGGGTSKRPLRREFVNDFLIAETEVTNAEYLEFVKATGYRSPDDWKGNTVQAGTESFPVANVSADDATAFCKWKSKQLGMETRLPTAAEWERAASGPNRFKYPWGNEWNEAAISSEKVRRPFPVKSFELNRSPFGAFDMVGNVWEWTSDQLSKNDLKSDLAIKQYDASSRFHLVMGGSFNEDRNRLGNSFWAEIDAKTRVKSVGFRYVIIPESNKIDN